MTSYQKLKAKIAELEKDRIRLLDDMPYFVSEHLKRRMRKSAERAYWFGDNEPTGEIEGLWERLMK